MAAIDDKIDELYKLPLAEFVTARTALAKTLNGEEAKRVKALTKPTVLPWAVNQLYWRARPVWDRLVKAGDKVRVAQIAALKGRAADLPAATAAHRQAIAEAVTAATKAAGGGGHEVATDGLARMLEAISLTESTPEPAGRLTKPLQPAGFEALAGIPIKALPARKAHTESQGAPLSAVQTKASPSAARRAEERRAAAERERAAEAERAIKKAQAAWERAKFAEERARKAWQKAKAEADAAEKELDRLREDS
jgi:hypothetical protein